ncbi:hypothetical protein ACFPLB_04240 [Aquamicrobium segne]|uniref:Uncharacterized protein n=1 Tax=Aquamicrobium segne TaxID=469547 RepID=A0ABW0GVP9_9HYPH
MNIGEIAERLIVAAEIEGASVRHLYGPQKPRSVSLPYEHSQADKNGWGTERLEEDRKEFFENLARQPSARQISEAEEAWGWFALVESELERAALSAWVRCMADNKRQHFQDWCKKNGIHRETGRRRKDRALMRISTQLSRSDAQHCNFSRSHLLHSGAENKHISDTVEIDMSETLSATSWMADGAFARVLPDRFDDFSWAEKRNERRRQREAAKRKKEAA